MSPFGHVIVIKRTGSEGFRYPLHQNTCVFGRGAECDIKLQLPVVSKQQCKIEYDPQHQEALLINLNTANPTLLNGAAFGRPVKLKHGDLITILDRSFRFEYENDFQNESKSVRTSEPKNKEVKPTGSQNTWTPDPEQCQWKEDQPIQDIPPKSMEGNIAAAKESKNCDASDYLEKHLGKARALRTKELQETPTNASGNVSLNLAANCGGNGSIFSTPDHTEENERDSFSAFRKLFGLMKEELNSKCQRRGDRVKSRKSEPPTRIHVDGSEGSKAPKRRRSQTPRSGASGWAEEGQMHKGQSAPCKGETRDSEDTCRRSSLSLAKESGEQTPDQGLQQPNSSRKRRKSEGLPAEHSEKRKRKEGSEKKARRRSTGTTLGHPSKAQSPNSLYTLRSQTKSSEMCSPGKGKLPKLGMEGVQPHEDQATPTEGHKPVLKESDSNSGGDPGDVAKSKGSTKGTRSGNQLSPRKALTSEQTIRKIQDEFYLEDTTSDSEELSAKRRRVSFGVHLRPELFDENLPPNTPLKRGETPGRKRMSLGACPRAVLKKPIIKQDLSKGAEEAAREEGRLPGRKSSQELAPQSPKKPAVASSEENSPSHFLGEDMAVTPQAVTTKSPAPKTAMASSKRPSTGRRSQHNTLQRIYAKRRSGASEANLMVVQSWADVVRLGTRKPQADAAVKHGLERRVVRKQKRLTPKKPASQTQNQFSTGHANSPCTILIGRAHTEKVTVPARPCRMFNNFISNHKMDMNEDLTGLAEMFKTPLGKKQKTAKADAATGTTPPLLSAEKSRRRTFSGAEPLLLTPNNLAETQTPTTEAIAEQTSGQNIRVCRRSPRNRQSCRGEEDIKKTPGEISQTRGDEILKTPLPDVSVAHKRLTPNLKRRQSRTPKENLPTPNLHKTETSPDQKIIDGEEESATHRLKLETYTEQSVALAEHTKTPNSRVGILKGDCAMEPKESAVGVSSSFRIRSKKDPHVPDQTTGIQKHRRTSLKNEESLPAGDHEMINLSPVTADSQGVVTITSQQQRGVDGKKRLTRTAKKKPELGEDLTGIRELLATPTPIAESREDKKLSRASQQVAYAAADENVQKNLETTPKLVAFCAGDAVVPKSLKRTPKQPTETEDLAGIQELMKTPKRKCEPVEHVTVVKRLMRTPEDKGELGEVVANSDRQMRTPKDKKAVVENTKKTPTPDSKEKHELTEFLRGIQKHAGAVEQDCESEGVTAAKRPRSMAQVEEPVESPKSNRNVKRTPKQKGRPSDQLAGLRRLLRTPKDKPEPSEDLTGLKELMATPKPVVKPGKEKNDKATTMSQDTQTNESAEDLREIKSLRNTPRGKGEPVEDRKGVKMFEQTPEQKWDLEGDLTGLTKCRTSPKERIEAVEDMKTIKNVNKSPEAVPVGIHRRTPKEKLKPVEDLTGIKSLLKTPKEKGEPVEVLTGIKRLMKTPQEKGEPVEDLTGIKRLMKTPKEKGEPVEDLTGIKRLMKTPKEKGEPVEVLTGIKRLMKTPKEKGEPVEDPAGIKRLMRTPKQKGEPVEDLTGIKRLMKTPKEKGEPVEDPAGIKRLMRTPKQKGEPVEDLTGIKRLMRTPKEKGKPVEDPAGIKRLMRTPKEKGEPVEDLTGIKRLMRTPKEKGEPVEDPAGIKRLMRTPKQKGEAVEDLTGIKRLMRTPKQKGEPVEDLTGIKRLMRTPKEKREPLEDLTGIKRLMSSPKEKREPVEDLTGIKRLMRTPREKREPVEDLTGIKRLMRTPKEKREPVEDLTGIKRLLRTPKEKKEPIEDLSGIKRLMRTPKQKGEPVEDLIGIKRLMRTPKQKGEPVEDLTDIAMFMETPDTMVDSLFSKHTVMESSAQEISCPESTFSEKSQDMEILRRPAIKDFSALNQENKTMRRKVVALQEVQNQSSEGDSCKSLKRPRKKNRSEADAFELKQFRTEQRSKRSILEVDCTGIKEMFQSPKETKDKFVDQCQDQICSNSFEDEYKSNASRMDGSCTVDPKENIMDQEILSLPMSSERKKINQGVLEYDHLSVVTDNIFMTKEARASLPSFQDKEKDTVENQRKISLRSRIKNKPDTELQGLCLPGSRKMLLKKDEETMKTIDPQSMVTSRSSSRRRAGKGLLEPSSLSDSTKVTSLEEEKKEEPVNVGGTIENVPFRSRRNQADKKAQNSNLLDMSGVESHERQPVENLKDVGMVTSRTRSRNKNRESPSESNESYTDGEKKCGKRKLNEALVPLRFSNRNKADKELQGSSPLASETEIFPKEDPEKEGIMAASRPRKRRRADPESQDLSYLDNGIVPSHTESEEKQPVKKRIVNKGTVALRSRKRNTSKEMLGSDTFPTETDLSFTKNEQEAVKSLPEKVKEQGELSESEKRNDIIEEGKEADSLSKETKESHTEDEHRSMKSYKGNAVVREGRSTLRTRSRNKTDDVKQACIEVNEKNPSKPLQTRGKATAPCEKTVPLRSRNRHQPSKESQQPTALAPEGGKPAIEEDGKGPVKAFQEKLEDLGPSRGMAALRSRNKKKLDVVPQGSDASSAEADLLNTEKNKPGKSFQEESKDRAEKEGLLSLRSRSKKRSDTEPPASHNLPQMSESVCVENSEKKPVKNLQEKKLKEHTVSQKISLRTRSRNQGVNVTDASVAAEDPHLKDEKEPVKVQNNLNDTIGNGEITLRSKRKSKMDAGLKGSDPMPKSKTYPEKDAEESMDTFSGISKSSAVPQRVLSLTRNRNRVDRELAEQPHLPVTTKRMKNHVTADKRKVLLTSPENKLNSKAEGQVKESSRSGSRSEADSDLHSFPLRGANELASVEKDPEATEKILKDRVVTVKSRLRSKKGPELIASNPLPETGDVSHSEKDEKENVQNFPNKRGPRQASLRTRLRNKSHADMQSSASLAKEDPAATASETTAAGKARNWKQVDSPVLRKTRGKSRATSINPGEPTSAENCNIPENDHLKSSQVQDETFKLIFSASEETQSESTSLRDESILLKNNTKQPLKQRRKNASDNKALSGNEISPKRISDIQEDTNSQEKGALRSRRKYTLKETRPATRSSKNNDNQKTKKNINA